MSNPYSCLPDHHFWRRSMPGRRVEVVDPVLTPRFRIGPTDRIATAGSCFAQHIARTLQASGFNYWETETAPASAGAIDENYGVFSARYGNIYTVRQLLQLLQRAFGLFDPQAGIWRLEDGRVVDPFRPVIQTRGFANEAELMADREAHLTAVQNLFERCDVFIFTFGLTEGWESQSDTAVVPLAPGVVAAPCNEERFTFHNFSVTEMYQDLVQFLTLLRKLNPSVRVILTVSPVALIATYDDRHVLTANTYSKAALRVVADMIYRDFDYVDYFPSYEMITGPHTRGLFLADDLREVTAEGVDYVMAAFSRHYLDADLLRSSTASEVAVDEATVRQQRSVIQSISQVICDEEHIERNS